MISFGASLCLSLNTQPFNINQWAQLDGQAGVSFADVLMGILQMLQSGQGMGGGAGQGAGGSAGTGGPANPYAPTGNLMNGLPPGLGDMSMPGHHGSLPGYGGGTGGVMPGFGSMAPYSLSGGQGGLGTGYGLGGGRVDLGMSHGPGHSMGSVHSMFDHTDPFTSIGYGRYQNTPASWSREGNTVTQQGTIRSHPELVQLATRQALEGNPNLSGDALYKDVAKRLTGYNNGGNGVAGAFGLSEDEAKELGRNFNHRLHDISAGGQQIAQRLADDPAAAIDMYNRGTLGEVAAVGRAGDTWRIEGGHTLQEDSFKSRAIGRTADGQVLWENTVESSNGANNGHDKHKMIAYSTGGPMQVDVVDDNNNYALENVDKGIVNHVAAGGNVSGLPVFGTGPLMGGHGAGHHMGMGMGMGGYGSSFPYGNFGMPAPIYPTLPPLPVPSSACPRTGGPVCSCDGNVSRGRPVSVFHGNMIH